MTENIEEIKIPMRLLRIQPRVKQLFMRGNLPDLDSFKVLAVVGSRTHSEYGERACRELIKGLAGYDILIVSGLAIGIDSIAHEAALEAKLMTIAVPGSGLGEKIIYPKSKLHLARRIIDSGGCLLSEYSENTVARPEFFPARNRVMAGLADAVLIIEAERKSGTSITAKMALNYNKDIFVVPGSIFSPLSEGAHYWAKQGAALVSSSKDIVEALGLEWQDNNESKIRMLFEECSEEERSLLALLPASREDIIQTISRPAHEVAMLISLLEIKELVKEDAGKIYRI